MFGTFIHPKPIGRRREVAELSIRVAAPEPIAIGHVLRVSADANPLVAPQMTAMEQPPVSRVLKFSVCYQLVEYLSFFLDHLPLIRSEYARRSGRTISSSSRFDWLLVAPIASLTFAYKRFRMPVCDFEVSNDGVQRTSKLGTMLIPWSEVTAVHRYSRGYLISKKSGSVPLPYRCFTEDGKAIFDGLVEQWYLKSSET